MKPVEEILKQYPYIQEDLKKAQSKLNEYIALQVEARHPLKGQVLSGMPHGSGLSDTTYNAVERIIDEYQVEIDKYTKEVNELLDLKRQLDTAYRLLTEDERIILDMHYDKRFSIRRIGDITRCGRYQAQKIIDDAKEKIKKSVA